MADPIYPVRNLTTSDVLYGDRTTSYRWEVLEHVNGVDQLIGTLDGVADGNLSWIQNAAVKGSGKMKVVDLAQAAPGMLKISDLPLESVRVRPVMTMNAGDHSGSYVDTWTEQFRNMIAYPKASGSVPTGWNVAATAGYAGDWVECTVTSGVPYIFSGLSQEAIAIGDQISAKISVMSLTSAIAYVRVNVHSRAGNIYFTGANTQKVIPVPLSTPVDVDLSWVATQAVAANNLDISVVPCDASGTFIAPAAGSKFRARYAMTAKTATYPVPYVDGDVASSVPYIRYRWTGATNASVSVMEYRSTVWTPDAAQLVPDIPWGTFLVESAVEHWDDYGRVWEIKLLDRCTVPDQDSVDQSYSVAAGTNILQEVRAILATAGEYLAIDEAVALATQSGMAWEAGTSKLKIVNDLLNVAGYNALWMDGYGNLQATPRVLPADRSILYELLGVPRELRDGELSIYRPEWTRERDSYSVPNKVQAIQSAGGDDAPALVGTWTNEDPASPYSYPSRGRWITHTLDGVECPEGSDLDIVAFLQKRAQTTLIQMSSVQAMIKVEHLPIPVRVSDVLRFSHSRAGIDARHVITRLDLDISSTGLMKSTLQEVITL